MPNVSNIKPVADILRRRQSSDRRDHLVPWFPYVPWRRDAGKVAIGMDEPIRVVAYTSKMLSTNQRGGLGRLETIMNTPPLLEAFDSFCQKALCGEVRISSNIALG